MAEKPLVLLALFEGLTTTVIDSTILDHARYLVNHDIARCEVWAFCTSKALFKEAQQRLKELGGTSAANVRVFRALRPWVPLSVAINAIYFRYQMWRTGLKPDVVHARGDYCTTVCGHNLARPKAPLIWDCRGHCVAEARERLIARGRIPKFLYNAKINQETRFRRSAQAACSAAAFVSTGLLEMFRIPGKPCVAIPNSASEDLFFFDPELRSRTREGLNYNKDNKVYVFSGSLKPYQRLDRIVAEFKALASRSSNARLLIITPDLELATRQVRLLDPNLVRVIRSPYIGVNALLNAADIAFLLRDRSDVNSVAFPTKYAEYSLAGLPVILDDAVRDVFRVAESIGNAVAPGPNAAAPPEYDRAEVAKKARGLLGRTANIGKYVVLYHKVINGSESVH